MYAYMFFYYIMNGKIGKNLQLNFNNLILRRNI